ncbi:hypothetical protein [Enterobacter hormaechei]|nr:hypothetical protein [Enterobacter hormaechei]
MLAAHILNNFSGINVGSDREPQREIKKFSAAWLAQCR